MVRKLMLMAIGAALGLGITFSSFAAETFALLTTIERLDIRKMVLETDEGRTYRLSPEFVPEFARQQSTGQLKTGTVVRISGHYGKTPDGVPEPSIERIQAVSR